MSEKAFENSRFINAGQIITEDIEKHIKSKDLSELKTSIKELLGLIYYKAEKKKPEETDILLYDHQVQGILDGEDPPAPCFSPGTEGQRVFFLNKKPGVVEIFYPKPSKTSLEHYGKYHTPFKYVFEGIRITMRIK